MTNLTFTENQFHTARKQFGRSLMMQLLIFMGIELVATLMFLVSSLLMDVLTDYVNQYILPNQSLDAAMQYLTIGTTISNFFTFAISVGVIFLHRSITFRCADHVMHNAMLWACLTFYDRFASMALSPILSQSVDFFYPLIEAEYAPAVFFLCTGLSILFLAVSSFAIAGTIYFSRKSDWKILLLLLPFAVVLLIAVLDPFVTYCSIYSHLGMTAKLYSRLPGLLVIIFDFILEYLLPYLLTSIASFFAMRLLVYRDTCDTTPKAQQQILQRYLMAYPLVLKQTVPVTPAESVAPQQPGDECTQD